MALVWLVAVAVTNTRTIGRATLLAEDHFDTGVHNMFGVVRDDVTGKEHRLPVPAGNRPVFRTGDTIEVTRGGAGVGQRSTLGVRVLKRPARRPALDSRGHYLPSSKARSAAVGGTGVEIRSVIAVVVLYADDGEVPWCNEEMISKLMYGAGASVRSLYLDSSYGDVDFHPGSGRIINVTIEGGTVNWTNETVRCPISEITEAADRALVAVGINPFGFDHRVYYLPDHIGCTFGGMAEVWGGNSWMYSSSGPVLAHELGHNLGMSHSSTDFNNDGVIDSEYGDSGDIMGDASGWHHLTAPHRHELGYLKESSIFDAHAHGAPRQPECVAGTLQVHSSEYRGKLATTVSGRTCQKWTSQSPHSHDRTAENYPAAGLGDHNNCRNPDGWENLWCTIPPSDAKPCFVHAILCMQCNCERAPLF